MGRGTPEEDLDTYMDNQDQQQAELDKEQEHADDIAKLATRTTLSTGWPLHAHGGLYNPQQPGSRLVVVSGRQTCIS